jgi:hypothetical protein
MEPDPQVLFIYESMIQDLRRTIAALQRTLATKDEALAVADSTIRHHERALAAARDIIETEKRIRALTKGRVTTGGRT